MTRASRFAAYSGVVTFAYALAWFKVFTIPLVSEEIVDQLLPVVRCVSNPNSVSYGEPIYPNTYAAWIDPLVAPGLRWIVFAGVTRDGAIHVQRYTTGV